MLEFCNEHVHKNTFIKENYVPNVYIIEHFSYGAWKWGEMLWDQQTVSPNLRKKKKEGFMPEY